MSLSISFNALSSTFLCLGDPSDVCLYVYMFMCLYIYICMYLEYVCVGMRERNSNLPFGIVRCQVQLTTSFSSYVPVYKYVNVHVLLYDCVYKCVCV